MRNPTMNLRASAALVLGLLAAGCSTPAPTAPAGAHPVSVNVSLQAPRVLLAAGHHWTAADINLYRLKLQVEAGDHYVDTGLTRDLAQQGQEAATGASFSNLAAGKKYRVRVEAWGTEGGEAATGQLNANTPCTLDFDFTGQDVPTHEDEVATVTLDAVAFSGTVDATQDGTPPGTASERVELWTTDGEAPVQTSSLDGVPARLSVTGLAAGPTYHLVVVALDVNGELIDKGSSAPFRFDPAAQDLPASLDTTVAFED